ncbi:MAG TPA: DUF3047 domain-containing protein [Bryobacteraceae bacterium]
MRRLRLLGCLLAAGFVGAAFSSELAVLVFNPEGWAKGAVPSDWRIKVNHGRADIDSCAAGAEPCVRFKSVDSSFGIERGLDVNLNQTPFLTWQWKVTQLPTGGDFRHNATDDQAAQVLVLFSDHRVLSYIWDSTAPQGFSDSDGAYWLVHVYAIVCESGPAQTGKWLTESRNVAADYRKAFGKPAPGIKGVRLQINSQHTGSAAESYFGEVAFRAQPQ